MNLPFFTISVNNHPRARLASVAATLAVLLALPLAACRPTEPPRNVVDRPMPDCVTLTVPERIFISPELARDLVRCGATFLDARQTLYHVAEHPRDAVRADWMSFADPDEPGRLHPEPGVLAERLAALGVHDQRPVIVIGGWNGAWGEEARIWWMLDTLGHPQTRIVSGGLDAWKKAGLPTDRGGTGPRAPGAFSPRARADSDPTHEDLRSGRFRTVDVRSREEFDGAAWHDVARGGHVDGARHLDWRHLFAPDGTLLPDAQRRALVPGDEPILAYCTLGIRSAFVVAALRDAGHPDVRHFPGGWRQLARTLPRTDTP